MGCDLHDVHGIGYGIHRTAKPGCFHGDRGFKDKAGEQDNQGANSLVSLKREALDIRATSWLHSTFVRIP